MFLSISKKIGDLTFEITLVFLKNFCIIKYVSLLYCIWNLLYVIQLCQMSTWQ